MRREYPDAPVAAVGVVVLRDSEVLLVRRGQEPNRGRWSLPGGAVEVGETVRQAAEREVREECAVDIKAGEVIEVLDAITPAPDGRVRFHYVLVELLADYVGGTPVAATDALEARWCPLDQLDHVESLPRITSQIIREGVDLRQRLQTDEEMTGTRGWQREFWS
jgi:8-oxo-dGTP diphosphatase